MVSPMLRRASSHISALLRPLPPFAASMPIPFVSETTPADPPPESSMELMAVPKRKVSKHRRGLRNGPNALKPVPVIVRCKACGRVKLPHFYCCSGERGNSESASS